MRILLVDDDKALTTVLAAALLEEGFEVSVAPNGAAGLRQFEAEGADLIVLDVLMSAGGALSAGELPSVMAWELARMALLADELWVPAALRDRTALHYLHPGDRVVRLCPAPGRRLEVTVEALSGQTASGSVPTLYQ
jgi:hypothetical protein